MKEEMNINQYNYEEFFLLYVDGELSATDKQAVEKFVQANPGLAVELEMLQQVQLTDESFIFSDKNSLYRSEATEISLNNHEEQFLLYVDNELDADAKEKVETFVLQHPALQESFTLLKSTRLEPEVILFPDKQSLYRKEEKERPVFYLRWQRVAVAAALLGVAVLVWTLLPDTKDQQQNIAGVQQTTIPLTGKKNDAAPVKTGDDTQTAIEQPLANTASVTKAIVPGAVKNELSNLGNNPVDANNLIAKNADPAMATGAAKGDVIATQSHGFNMVTPTREIISGDNTVIENADVLKGPHEDINIQQVAYKELDTEDEKKSLLLGSLEINKDKLRGFFRKAGSFFRGKSKTEDDKTESRPSTNARSLK
jgi:tellurite resistance protein